MDGIVFDGLDEEQLAEKYYSFACKVASRWVRHGTLDYAEACSEAHLALLQCIRGNFDPARGSFEQYLATAVNNCIRMYLRKHRARFEHEVSFAVCSLEDTAAQPFEDTLEDSDAVASIVTALQQLQPREAESLLLRASGETQHRIALQLQLSDESVSRILRCASKKVHMILTTKRIDYVKRPNEKHKASGICSATAGADSAGRREAGYPETPEGLLPSVRDYR